MVRNPRRGACTTQVTLSPPRGESDANYTPSLELVRRAAGSELQPGRGWLRTALSVKTSTHAVTLSNC